MANGSNIRLDDDILLFQILPRLQARSLGRCKCVCKQWHSFLTTPVFTKMYLHHVNNENHDKQLLVCITKPWRYFQTIDCETPEVGLSVTHSIPFKVNGNRMSIISSLNGLVCVGINSSPVGEYKYSDIILWNPLTGDYKTLSKDNSDGNCFSVAAKGYGLYYSCSDDDYKLLCITQSSDAYIYSLKSDSWRKVESTVGFRLRSWNFGCFLNEKLYFLGQGTSQTSPWSYLIIRFDTRTEKFTEMPAPSLKYVTACLTVVSGCLHLYVISKGDKWEVWKMDDDREWRKLVCYGDVLCRFAFSWPLHQMKNGNWLLGSIDKGYVIGREVDPEMKIEKKVHVYTAVRHGIHILWRGKFVETIVSLKRVSSCHHGTKSR